MTLGDRIYVARTRKRWTRKKLSEESGIAAATILSYENDGVEPAFFKLCCIADALGVSLDYLAGKEGDK